LFGEIQDQVAIIILSRLFKLFECSINLHCQLLLVFHHEEVGKMNLVLDSSVCNPGKIFLGLILNAVMTYQWKNKALDLPPMEKVTISFWGKSMIHMDTDKHHHLIGNKGVTGYHVEGIIK